jgi:hypothetical protein
MTTRIGPRARFDVALLILVVFGVLAPTAVHAVAHTPAKVSVDAAAAPHGSPTRHPDVRAASVGAQFVVAQPTRPRPQGSGLTVAVAAAVGASIRPRSRRFVGSHAREQARFALRRGPPVPSTV